MKNRKLITVNLAIITLLIIELIIMACDLMVLAVVTSIAVAIVSVVIFVIDRGGESTIAAVANVGYAFAITSWGIFHLISDDATPSIILGTVTFIVQILLTVARQQGRL